MINAVIIGFAHMHVNEIAVYIDETEDFRLVGLADVPLCEKEKTDARYTRAWNIKNNSEKYGITPHEDYRVMLDELKPDIAFIVCDNASKPEVVEECAKRGVNVCIEKPMAVNLEEALKIKATVDKYGIEAIVNWPVLWRPFLHKQIAAYKSGIVGKLIKSFYINGHTGPLGKGAKHRGVSEKAEELTDEQRASTWWYKNSTGGGAFLDIGCYGCFFTEWIRDGKDKLISVNAHSENYCHPYMDAPDNIVAVVEYENSYSVLEGTWTTPQISLPTGPVYTCTEGVLYCDQNREAAAYDIYGEKIELPEYEIPPHIKHMPDHYAYCKKTGTPILKEATLDFNIAVMRLLDAAMNSANSGEKIKV